ncbi:hypothetical protein B0H10DRAFT_2211194 [Mycena sp. CBHHK59/15]|nr:hypothetical protein B0H10DRAFT_2211194 [Mycena sp. CBHHK59/15]
MARQTCSGTRFSPYVLDSIHTHTRAFELIDSRAAIEAVLEDVLEAANRPAAREEDEAGHIADDEDSDEREDDFDRTIVVAVISTSLSLCLPSGTSSPTRSFPSHSYLTTLHVTDADSDMPALVDDIERFR